MKHEPVPGLRGKVELVVALLGASALLSPSGLRALLFANVRTIFGGLASALALISEDVGTVGSMALALFRAGVLLGLPLAVMLRARSRHHLAWAPLLLIGFALVFGLSLPALSSWGMWLAFVIAAGVGAWAIKKRVAVLVALLPWVVCLEPLFGHGPPSAWVWTPERLMERCAGNDGVRPVDLRPEVVSTRYFSVTPLSASLQLLAGERMAFWVHRDERGAATLGSPVPGLMGNFWEGCVREGTVWLGKRGFVCDAREAASKCVEAPGPEGSTELDYVDVYCPPGASAVFVSQLLRGGVLEFDPATSATTLHEVVPGLNLQLAGPRADGLLVGITTTRLVVIDPRTWKVVEERSAGLVAMGIDVCPADGAALVTDFAGRVRLFERGADGAYRVTRAASVPAARRVAWAPGCGRAVVTSGDDRHAWLLRRDLTQAQVFRLGPGLRDVTFVDAQTAAVADACTVTYLSVPPEGE